MLALDHRSSFRKMLKDSGRKTSKDILINYKQKILTSVWDQCSGVLIDPKIGLIALRNTQRQKKKPYLLCLEKSGYQEDQGVRQSSLKYSVNKLKQHGANGVKLLLYINPNLEKTEQAHQLSLANQAIKQAEEVNLPIFLEIITYGNSKFSILESVSLFLEKDIIPDVFKLEFPGNSLRCRQITNKLEDIPWILLTRGKRFDIFKEELKVAISAGAKGFLAGRALWQEIFKINDEDEEKFLKQTLPERFYQLSQIALQ